MTIGSEPSEEIHPVLRPAGKSTRRSKPLLEGPIPGTRLSAEASTKLRQELHEINIAEMAVRGSNPNP